MHSQRANALKETLHWPVILGKLFCIDNIQDKTKTFRCSYFLLSYGCFFF